MLCIAAALGRTGPWSDLLIGRISRPIGKPRAGTSSTPNHVTLDHVTCLLQRRGAAWPVRPQPAGRAELPIDKSPAWQTSGAGGPSAWQHFRLAALPHFRCQAEGLRNPDKWPTTAGRLLGGHVTPNHVTPDHVTLDVTAGRAATDSDMRLVHCRAATRSEVRVAVAGMRGVPARRRLAGMFLQCAMSDAGAGRHVSAARVGGS